MKLKRMLGAVLSAGLVLTSMPQVTAETSSEPKLIALTFDDGPNTTTTNDVLDILEQYDARATFFLVGNCINEESAQSVKRAYDMGCEIGNHSKTHSNMSSMSEEEVKAEIDYVDEKVIEIIGESTAFFRPPFIDTSQTMYDAIDKPFICGIDCGDYMENVTAQQRADNILNGAKDGVIVLLHDLAGNNQTVEALEIVMPKLVEQGYEFVTVSELFERQGETPKEELIYTYVTKYPCTDYTLKRNLFSGEATGDSSSGDWSNINVFDAQELKELGDSYAIEVDYEGVYSPQIALQRWTGTPIWQTVTPSYSNGEKACFLAEDILSALEAVDVDYTDLDRITIRPSNGTMTLTNMDLLVKSEENQNTTEEITSDTTTATTDEEQTLKGDVNADNELTVSDVVSLQKWLVKAGEMESPQSADMNENDVINIFDLCILKRLFV